MNTPIMQVHHAGQTLLCTDSNSTDYSDLDFDDSCSRTSFNSNSYVNENYNTSVQNNLTFILIENTDEYPLCLSVKNNCEMWG